jgi:hypothetical protein
MNLFTKGLCKACHVLFAQGDHVLPLLIFGGKICDFHALKLPINFADDFYTSAI